MNLSTALLLLASRAALAASNAPSWYTNGGVHREGKSLVVTCTGSGPAADLARRAALQACNATAADFLAGDYHVRAVTIETDASSAYHSEAISDLVVSGLACNLSREEERESYEEHQAFLECRYDTRKAQVTRHDQPEVGQEDKGNEPIAAIENSFPTRGSAPLEEKPVIQSDEKTLLITILPSCVSILVRGKLPRVVKCGGQMPLPLLVHHDDKELIVRGEKGYLPKHVKLKPRRGLVSAEDLTLQIILERK